MGDLEEEEVVQRFVFSKKDVGPEVDESGIVNSSCPIERAQEHMEKSHKFDLAALKRREEGTVTLIALPSLHLCKKRRLDLRSWNFDGSAHVLDKAMKIECRTDIAEINENRPNVWLLHLFSPRMRGNNSFLTTTTMLQSPKAKKILIFSLTYYPKYVGGAEVAIKEITDRIAPDDIAFDMITLRFDRMLPREERIGNVMVYRIGPTKKDPQIDELVRFPMYMVKVLYPLLAAWKAFRLHRSKHYSGAWAMMSYMGFPLVMLRYLFFIKLPYVLTLQEGDSVEHVTKRWRIRMVAFLYAPIYRFPRIVQTISTYLSGFARDRGYTGPLLVVPNAVDTQYF